MNRRAELPPQLRAGAVFLTRDALSLGVEPGRLRARDLVAPLTGLRVSSAATPTLRDRCEGVLARLDGPVCVSGHTAGSLHGMPLPRRLERFELIDVTVPVGHRAPHAAGIRGHQRKLRDSDVIVLDGIPITTPTRTLCDLAQNLTQLEAVQLADWLIARSAPIVTEEELVSGIRAFPGRRGTRMLRTVLELMDGGSESPKETETRLLIIASGFPRPACNIDVYGPDGGWIGRCDLVYEEARIAVEYEGDQHRTDKVQWRRDHAKRRALRAAGWIVLPLTQDDLTAPRAFLESLAAAFRTRDLPIL